jgi:hypothetical protein
MLITRARASVCALSMLLCLMVVALAAGCGGSSPATDLTMVAVNSNVGRAVFHIECAPIGGDLPNPARACAALAAAPQLVTKPKPFVCIGGTTSWWDVTITGRLNGRPIHRSLSTCWTPQMATLGRFELGGDVLQKHLVSRRQEAVLAGTRRVFLPGVLRPADLVTCDIPGHHLALGVPTQTGGPASTTRNFGGRKVVAVTVAVALRPDGSVSASCHLGALLPSVPRWLKASETRTLDSGFGHARPIHTDYIWYPHKVAVIWEFSHIVICGTCSAPSNASLPRGRVIRVSFNRTTHRMGDALQFCAARDSSPSRAVCLRR